jgi:hypothetical protein
MMLSRESTPSLTVVAIAADNAVVWLLPPPLVPALVGDETIVGAEEKSSIATSTPGPSPMEGILCSANEGCPPVPRCC